jgi:hypothetical protein
MGMHKRYSVVTVVDDSGNGLIKGKMLENRDILIVSFLKNLEESLEDDVRVVIEAGSNRMWMADLLDVCGIKVSFAIH